MKRNEYAIVVPQGSVLTFEVDGMEYPLDIADLNGSEVGTLKRVGHLRGAADIPEAVETGDLEAIAALVGIAMARQGITPDYDKLLALKIGEIKVSLPEQPEDPTEAAAMPQTTATPANTGTPSLPSSTE